MTVRQGAGSRWVARFLIAAVVTILYVFPLYWMFVTSIKQPADVLHTPPLLIPQQPQIDSYRAVLDLPTDRPALLIDGLRYIRNSFLIALGTTLLTLLLGIPGAYALARFKLRGRSLYLLFMLVAQMLPSVLLVVPLFILFKNLGLINTVWGVILADTALALPFAVIILRTSFLQVPRDLEEAALIDCGSRLLILWKVVLPLVRSGIIAIGVFAFLTAWGEFVFALSFLQDEQLQPVSVGIFKFIGMYTTQWDSMMAFASLVALPALVAFIFLQRYFAAGITAGAVK